MSKLSGARYNVPAVPRAEIDRWPIREAGLPARVVNTATRLKLQTVADLRNLPPERLLGERRFGRRSLDATMRFFETCAELEAGKIGFRTIREPMDRVLAPEVWQVLVLRYGLERPDLDASRQYFTLQAIANRDDVTRERVRQVVEIGLAGLGQRLLTAFLEPFEKMLMDIPRAQGGIAEADAYADLVGHPAMAGLNPAAVALLLCDAHPQSWTYFGRAFILAPDETVKDFAHGLVRRLRRRQQPTPWAEVLAFARRHRLAGHLARLESTLPLLLSHLDGVIMMKDRSCLASERLGDLLDTLIRELGGRAHYTDIADRFNERVQPQEQRSASSILRLLIASRRFRTTDLPGCYGTR